MTFAGFSGLSFEDQMLDFERQALREAQRREEGEQREADRLAAIAAARAREEAAARIAARQEAARLAKIAADRRAAERAAAAQAAADRRAADIAAARARDEAADRIAASLEARTPVRTPRLSEVLGGAGPNNPPVRPRVASDPPRRVAPRTPAVPAASAARAVAVGSPGGLEIAALELADGGQLRAQNAARRRAFDAVPGGSETRAALELAAAATSPSRVTADAEERLFASALAHDEAAAVAGPPSVLRQVREALREDDERLREAKVRDIASTVPLGLESLDAFRLERELDAHEAAMRSELDEPGHPDAVPGSATRPPLLSSSSEPISDFEAHASFLEGRRRQGDAVTAIQRATGAARAAEVADRLEEQSALDAAFRREILGEVGGADLVRAMDAEAAVLEAAQQREMLADPGGEAVLRAQETERPLAEEALRAAPLLPGRGAFSEDEIDPSGGGLDVGRTDGPGASKFGLSLDEEALFASPSSEMFLPERLIELMGVMRTPGRSLSPADLDFIDRFSNEDHQRALRIWELESSGLGVDQAIATALRNGAPLDFEDRYENIIPLMMGLGAADFVLDDLFSAPIRTIIRQGPQAFTDPVQAAREQQALDEARGGILGSGISDSRLFTWIPDNDLFGTDLSFRDLGAGGFEAIVDVPTIASGGFTVGSAGLRAALGPLDGAARDAAIRALDPQAGSRAASATFTPRVKVEIPTGTQRDVVLGPVDTETLFKNTTGQLDAGRRFEIPRPPGFTRSSDDLLWLPDRPASGPELLRFIESTADEVVDEVGTILATIPEEALPAFISLGREIIEQTARVRRAGRVMADALKDQEIDFGPILKAGENAALGISHPGRAAREMEAAILPWLLDTLVPVPLTVAVVEASQSSTLVNQLLGRLWRSANLWLTDPRNIAGELIGPATLEAAEAAEAQTSG